MKSLNVYLLHFQWDQSVIIKSEPLVLEGGYENFLLYYPTLTTNSNVTRPDKMIDKDIGAISCKFAKLVKL